MNTKKLQQVLDKTVESILKSKKEISSEDLKLKKILVFDFFTSLLEDEILQAEYRIEDIALVAILAWNNQTEESQRYSEERIRSVLYEPIQNNHFCHYGKTLRRDEAYEFIFHAVLNALEKNNILIAELGALHEKAISIMNLYPQIPMPQRNRFGLLSAIGLVDAHRDPAIEEFVVVMN